MTKSEKIILRAVNASKKTSPATYIALRLLIDEQQNKNKLQLIEKYFLRKLITTNQWNYHKFSWFKKIDDNGQPVYRTFYIGSPTTLIVEAYILALLSEHDVFCNHSQNFSYYLPKEYESYNFSYYYKGYKNRNIAITKLLEQDENLQAFVFDLSNYYPSINKDEVLGIMQDKLAQIEIDNKVRAGIIRFIKCALDASESGIPVNPDIGHLLGSVMLKSFDEELFNKYGDNYFRYVDDMVIIANANEAEQILATIEKYLPNGAQLNHDKYQVVNYEEWKILTEEINNGTDDNFARLTNDIQLYLSMQDNASVLQKKLRNHGVSLPIYRLYTSSRYAPWQAYVRRQYYTLKRHLKNLTEDVLAQRTVSIKSNYLLQLSSLDNIEDMKSDITKKVLLRQYHYLINRLLYLCNPKEYAIILLPLIPHGKDFFETRAVLNAIVKNDITEILSIGGKAVLTYCDIWKSNVLSNPRFNPIGIQEQDFQTLHSLGMLSLHGVINLSDKVNIMDIVDTSLKEFLRFCSQETIEQRLLDDFSYNDELLSLRIGHSFNELQEKLFSRYKSKEKLYFPGLQLDEKGYYSL